MNDAVLKSPSVNRVDPATYTQLSQFLGYEARLLDNEDFDAWLELLDPAIDYEIPIRLSVVRDSAQQFTTGAYRLKDDLAMIRKRVERTTTEEDWSEAPLSRTLRSVGSI